MKLRFKDWKNITIKQYYEIVDIAEDPELSKQEREIKLVSYLTGEPESKVQLLPALELEALVVDAEFLKSFSFDQKHCPRRMKIAEKKFRVILEPAKLTTAQYLDFKTFYGYRDLKTYYGNVLACFLIPEEAKGYGDNYDPLEIAKFLYDNVTIQEANTLMFFFLKKLDLSMRITLAYLDFLMKRLAKKNPGNPKIQEARKVLEAQVKRMLGYRS